MISAKVSEASAVWKHLNGIINVYKPAGVSFYKVRNAIVHNICKGNLKLK